MLVFLFVVTSVLHHRAHQLWVALKYRVRALKQLRNFLMMQEQLKKTQVDAAIKVALLSEHALDVDYLTFKLTENGEIELDENGNIKGWDDKIAGLKTKFPTQFDTANTEKKIEENKLEKGEQNQGGVTKSDLLKMPYNERMKLYTENKEAYEQAMHS